MRQDRDELERIESSEGVIENPRKFMSSFYSSEEFDEAYRDFFKGKRLTPDVTDEEKKQVFFESEKAKQALINFGMRIKLKFSSDHYPQSVARVIDDYISAVKSLLNTEGRRISGDEMIELDQHRNQLHVQAASILASNEIVPSVKLGKVLCRLILIDEGLDTFDSARVPDILRIQKSLD